MEDLFATRHISPMLCFISEPFDSEDFVFELKLDGIRCIAYLSPNETSLKNRKDKDILQTFPELKNINKCVQKKCILDGELVCLGEDNKPDFFALQSRCLKSDKFKIELAQKLSPVQYCVFDILYYDDKNLINLPLLKRKDYLKKYVKEQNGITISRYIAGNGKDFFELIKKRDLEGIVAKRVDSVYKIGKRSESWLKIKTFNEDDVIICAYELNKNGKLRTTLFGTYDKNNEFKILGKVSLGILPYQKIIISQPKGVPLTNKYPNMNWIQPSLVATIKYLIRTESGGFRQPVFKCIREDKTIKDIRKDAK